MADAITLAGLSEIEIAGTVVSMQGGPSDLTSRYNTTTGTGVSLGQSDSVVIPVAPVVTFEATPETDDAGITLPVTAATSTSTTLTLTNDDYSKLAIGRLDALNEATRAALAKSIGESLIRLGNNVAHNRAAADAGTKTILTHAVAAITAQELWSALNAATSPYLESGYNMADFDMVISARMWNLLNDDIAVLRASTDAKQAAADKLGVGQVTVTAVPSVTTLGSHVGCALLIHRNTLAVAKRVDDVRLREGDASDYLISRARTGAKLIVPGLVTAIAAQ